MSMQWSDSPDSSSPEVGWARPRVVAAVATAAFVAHLALSLLVIPPWQQPDEPQYLAFVRLLKHVGPGRSVDELVARYRAGERDDPVTERLIVASMIQHGWWRHYGRPDPPPGVHAFEAPAAVVHAEFGLPGGPTAWIVMSARILQALSVDDVETQLHVLRGVSAVLGVLTLWAAYAGAHLLFGPAIAAGAVILLALHPQFTLVSTMANPDALVNFWGSVAWWQAGRLFAGRTPTLSLLAMIAAAAVASVIKRLGLPVLAASFCIAGIWMVTASRRPLLHGAAAIAAVLIGIGSVWLFLPDEWARLVAASRFIDERWRIPLSTGTLVRLRSFIRVLFESSWLVAGWLRYPAAPAWIVGWALIVAASIGGVVLCWRRSDVGLRRALAVAGLFAVFQIAAPFAVHFPIGSGPQGRYLFPALAPIICLIWIGWTNIAGPQYARRLALSLVVFACLFAVSGWATVLLPAYAAG